MGLNLNSLKLDANLVENGVWCDLEEGASVLVARSGNTKHSKLLAQLRKPYRSYELSGRPLPDDVARKIGIEAAARTLLLDWKGIDDDDGHPIPFNYDNAVMALGIEGFLNRVLGFCNDESTFKGATVDDMSKNLSASSIGKSSGDVEA